MDKTVLVVEIIKLSNRYIYNIKNSNLNETEISNSPPEEDYSEDDQEYSEILISELPETNSIPFPALARNVPSIFKLEQSVKLIPSTAELRT